MSEHSYQKNIGSQEAIVDSLGAERSKNIIEAKKYERGGEMNKRKLGDLLFSREASRIRNNMDYNSAGEVVKKLFSPVFSQTIDDIRDAVRIKETAREKIECASRLCNLLDIPPQDKDAIFIEANAEEEHDNALARLAKLSPSSQMGGVWSKLDKVPKEVLREEVQELYWLVLIETECDYGNCRGSIEKMAQLMEMTGVYPDLKAMAACGCKLSGVDIDEKWIVDRLQLAYMNSFSEQVTYKDENKLGRARQKVERMTDVAFEPDETQTQFLYYQIFTINDHNNFEWVKKQALALREMTGCLPSEEIMRMVWKLMLVTNCHEWSGANRHYNIGVDIVAKSIYFLRDFSHTLPDKQLVQEAKKSYFLDANRSDNLSIGKSIGKMGKIVAYLCPAIGLCDFAVDQNNAADIYEHLFTRALVLAENKATPETDVEAGEKSDPSSDGYTDPWADNDEKDYEHDNNDSDDDNEGGFGSTDQQHVEYRRQAVSLMVPFLGSLKDNPEAIRRIYSRIIGEDVNYANSLNRELAREVFLLVSEITGVKPADCGLAEERIVEVVDSYIIIGNLKCAKEVMLSALTDSSLIKERTERKIEQLTSLADAIPLIIAENGGYDYREWSMLGAKDMKSDQSKISEFRERLINRYNLKEQYDLAMNYLGHSRDTEDIIWKYIGTRNRHDMLVNFNYFFITVLQPLEQQDGRSRRDLVRNLFVAAGMGTGLQAYTLQEVMGLITPALWKKMENESFYNGQNPHPPLSDINSINLQKIKNELLLHSTPELKEALDKLPPGQEQLRAYAMALSQPTVNITAVKNFVADPGLFFASRTGAGEMDGMVNRLLADLSPDMLPGWDATHSRDSIINGVYDRLNAFNPVMVEWHDDPKIKKIERDTNEIIEEYKKNQKDERNLLSFCKKYFLGVDSASRVAFMSAFENIRQNFFADYMCAEPDRLRSFLEHAGKAGRRIIDLAYKFKIDRETKEIDKLIDKENGALKFIDGEKIKIEKKAMNDGAIDVGKVIGELVVNEQKIRERLLELNGRKDVIDSQVDVQKNETVKTLDELISVPDQDRLRRFWSGVFTTGWLEGADLSNIIKRATGNAFVNEDEWLAGEWKQKGGDFVVKSVNQLLEIVQKNAHTRWYRAEVLRPSNPEAAIAGSITGMCDAFGHGKKAHFMTHPLMAQFVLKESKVGWNVQWDANTIAAQSTLTLDKLVFENSEQRKKFVQELHNNGGIILSALQASGWKGSELDFLNACSNAEDQICLDSVEVSPNIRKQILPQEIYKILQTAFSKMAEKDSRFSHQTVVGTNWSYLTGVGLPEEKNRGMWPLPIAYSDNPHENETAILLQKSRGKVIDNKSKLQVRPLRPADALSVAVMEDVAFRRTGGESYITGFISISRELEASCLQSEFYGLKPLSFVDISHGKDGRKQPNGYLIAFMRDNEDIYITDTATTGVEKGVGTRLLMNLLNSVGTDPKCKGKFITMDCRGATSAKAISKPNNRALVEKMEFKEEQTGKVVKFRVEGPGYEEITGDSLYHYKFVRYYKE